MNGPTRAWTVARVARATVTVCLIVTAFVVGLFLLWQAKDAVLVLLVGVVFAVIFDAGARLLGHVLPWPRVLRLLIAFLLFLAIVGVVGWFGGSTLVDQAAQLYDVITTQLVKLGGLLSRNGQPQQQGSLADLLPSVGALFGSARDVVVFVTGGVAAGLTILFLGVFMSWEPRTYQGGLLSLLPAGRRQRVLEVLDLSGQTMRDWLTGQSISMAIIFAFTLVALSVIGMPYAFLLSVQAGLLTFIPTIGPILSGVPIVLAGLSQNVTLMLYGVGVYVVIQVLESDIVTPLVQKRTVRLPPAFCLGSQLVMGSLFGLIGVAFAVPLMAALKVIIEELYVRDRLGGPWHPFAARRTGRRGDLQPRPALPPPSEEG